MTDDNYKNRRKKILTSMLRSGLEYESLLVGVYGIVNYVVNKGEVSLNDTLPLLLAGALGYIGSTEIPMMNVSKSSKLEENLNGGK